MDPNSSNDNDDEEPKVCTVFSSTSSSNIFDTIAFSVTRKEATPSPVPEPVPASMFFTEKSNAPPGGSGTLSASASASGLNVISVTDAQSKSGSLVSLNADDLQSGEGISSSPMPFATPTMNTAEEDSSTSVVSQDLFLAEAEQPISVSETLDYASSNFQSGGENLLEFSASAPTNVNIVAPPVEISPPPLFDENLVQVKQQHYQHQHQPQQQEFQNVTEKLGDLHLQLEDEEGNIPTANSLFQDAPEVPFPVNIGFSAGPQVPPGPAVNVDINSMFTPTPVLPQSGLGIGDYQFSPEAPQIFVPSPTSSVSSPQFHNYLPANASYEAWIPSEEIRQALIAVKSGNYFPEASRLIMPGIIHDEEFADKVGLNIGRIFGEAEASKRKILTADNVNQDEGGLRELIKLGCYRSALNLTKRLLTQYGQGPGKLGQYCKHSPHSLQLWFARISLLVRIREFTIAGAEVEVFKDFESVDMYYEFYGPDSYGEGRKGTMVPFYFRLLAAEIPQYNRQFNETIDKLTLILITVQQIVENLENGLSEDGRDVIPHPEQKEISLEIWRKREIRVLYSLANASLFSKDYSNAFSILTKLCFKDRAHEPQLKSAIARLFLQHGDLVSAQKYFLQSSDLRNPESESDQVDTLVDSALTAIAQSSYAEALSFYKQALIIQPDNFTILNNMAVCLLYMGKLKESLALMETTVRQNTPQSLQENVLLNLSSIYELENSDGHKKHALLKLIGEYKGDGVNLASLKLPNLL